jgi:hypothetical protein
METYTKVSTNRDSSTVMVCYSAPFKVGSTKASGLTAKCRASELVNGKMEHNILVTGLRVSSKDRVNLLMWMDPATRACSNKTSPGEKGPKSFKTVLSIKACSKMDFSTAMGIISK